MSGLPTSESRRPFVTFPPCSFIGYVYIQSVRQSIRIIRAAPRSYFLSLTHPDRTS